MDELRLLSNEAVPEIKMKTDYFNTSPIFSWGHPNPEKPNPKPNPILRNQYIRYPKKALSNPVKFLKQKVDVSWKHHVGLDNDLLNIQY